MKKILAVMVILAIVFMSLSTAFSAEVFAPGIHKTGEIGKSTRYWQWGRFQYMNNPRVSIASKDWATASNTAWTLSATEQDCAILVMTNGGSTGNYIVAPSETGRIYHVFNRSGYAVTIKKSGGTGVSISNNVAAIVGYFQIGAAASTDYYVLSSTGFSY